jgi:hypothetical protein
VARALLARRARGTPQSSSVIVARSADAPLLSRAQYANGGTLAGSLRALWAEGGVRRLYQGVSIAIVQAPLSRFGDTAANTGVLALFALLAPGVPLPLATAVASAGGAAWRLLLTPLDTLKTARQVAGPAAGTLLAEKVAARGAAALFDGALASAAASWVGRCARVTHARKHASTHGKKHARTHAHIACSEQVCARPRAW